MHTSNAQTWAQARRTNAHTNTHIQNYGHPTEKPTTNDANKFCSQNWEIWPEIVVNCFCFTFQQSWHRKIAIEQIPLYHLSFGLCVCMLECLCCHVTVHMCGYPRCVGFWILHPPTWQHRRSQCWKRLWRLKTHSKSKTLFCFIKSCSNAVCFWLKETTGSHISKYKQGNRGKKEMTDVMWA